MGKDRQVIEKKKYDTKMESDKNNDSRKISNNTKEKKRSKKNEN